ncbi:MAG: protease modulator HflK [bacterium]
MPAPHDHDAEHAPRPQASSERAALGGDVASQALNEALRVSFRLLKLAMVLVAVLFLTSGVFIVKQHEQAFKLRFGKLVRDREGNAILGPGIHFAWPFLIDEIVRFPVRRDLPLAVDAFWYVEPKRVPGGGVPQGLPPDQVDYTLTGDANILHSKWRITYSVADPVQFCRRVADPSEIATQAPQGQLAGLLGTFLRSAVIRTMARFDVDEAYTERRDELKEAVRRSFVQQTADAELGIQINTFILDDISPPLKTRKAFDAVNAAAQEKDRLLRDAEGYATRVVTEARGDAERIVEEARAYKSRVVQRAQADADYIESVVAEYRQSPRMLNLFLEQRLIEVLEETLSEADETFVIDLGTGDGRREVRLWLQRDPQAQREAIQRRRQERQQAQKEQEERRRRQGRE